MKKAAKKEVYSGTKLHILRETESIGKKCGKGSIRIDSKMTLQCLWLKYK